MMNERKLHRDGLLSAMGGQDSGRDTSLLNPTQFALGINVMCRGGFLESRYGLKKRVLTFENDEVEDWYEDSLFQGADYYVISEHGMLIASSGGRIFKIDVENGFQSTEITPEKGTSTTAAFTSPAVGSSSTIGVSDNATIHVGYPVKIGSGRYTVTAKAVGTITVTNLDATAGVNVASGSPVYYLQPNPSLLPRIWTLQAENYFLIQNGSDACIIYDGATARRAVRAGTKLEVPTGTAMAYWQGRIWVAVNKREIEAGDIYGGPTRIIDFTETTYLAEGGRFRVPGNVGDITALKVLPVLDTSLGQGPLQVFTDLSGSSLNLPVARSRWKDIDQPIQPISLLNFGPTSQFGTVVVNGDLFFRAKDGLRSFAMTRRETGTYGHVPISREMSRVMDSDDERFLQYGSAVLFKNLLLFTVNPLPIESGRSAYWRGLGVLDFDLISSLGQKSPPVYPGVWTGVQVMQVTKGTFAGKERCFIFARSAEGKNELWEVIPEVRFDNDCLRIQSVVETRAMDYGLPKRLHMVENAELWVDNVEGTVDFTLKYRKDHSPCWQDFGTAEACAKTTECAPAAGECFTFKKFNPGYKTRIGFGQPPDEDEAFNGSPVRLGYQHEYRLSWLGHARIKGFITKAFDKSEEKTKAPE